MGTGSAIFIWTLFHLKSNLQPLNTKSHQWRSTRLKGTLTEIHMLKLCAVRDNGGYVDNVKIPRDRIGTPPIISKLCIFIKKKEKKNNRLARGSTDMWIPRV